MLTPHAARSLAALCAQIVSSSQEEWTFAFAPELRVGDDLMVPAIAGWRGERDRELPDWICDVVPNGSPKRWAACGVAAAWRLDPAIGVIEVLERGASGWFYNAYGDHMQAAPFRDVSVDVAALWEG